jgi:isoamylase
MGYTVGDARGDLSASTRRDSAPFMPRCVVEDPSGRTRRPPPCAPPQPTRFLYEAHVKGLTALHPGPTRPGQFPWPRIRPVLEHLTRLGITAIELLPVQAFLDDRFLVERGLVNYWGYQTWASSRPSRAI